MADVVPMTLRLPAELAKDLAIVADCDGQSVTDAVRAAVGAWVSQRRLDPEFQSALAQHIARAERLVCPEVRT